ncbi:hypothetical protein RCL1_007311 [Eukaryota sp. TZLM3-RCL]
MDGLHNAIEIIESLLFFFIQRRKILSLDSISSPNNDCFFFTTDDLYTYEPFVADFGPLHLGHTINFIRKLEQILSSSQHEGKRIYYCTSSDHSRRENAIFLICAFATLSLNKTPDEAVLPFLSLRPPLVPFRDASSGLSTFNLTILDLMKSLVKARSVGLFDLSSFDVVHYEFYSRVENGDMNWIIPGKILALAGPVEEGEGNQTPGYSTLTPGHYIPYFKKHNVSDVVRLNKKCYSAQRFTSEGINHHTMYFLDGSCPCSGYVRKFINIVDSASGAIAVHCKAGLGRTGTLIACWMMKEYMMTAVEALGWLRVVRPGSVIGPQQNFLVDMQAKIHKYARQLREQAANAAAGNNSPALFPSPNAPSQVLINRGDVTAKSPLNKSVVQGLPVGNPLDTPPARGVRSQIKTSSPLAKRLERLSL